jgi:hypothetical protein
MPAFRAVEALLGGTWEWRLMVARTGLRGERIEDIENTVFISYLTLAQTTKAHMR